MNLGARSVANVNDGNIRYMSMTAVEFWAGLWRTSETMINTGVRFAEMMQASGQVIDSRTRTILAASCDSLNGDYADTPNSAA